MSTAHEQTLLVQACSHCGAFGRHTEKHLVVVSNIVLLSSI